MVYTRKRRKKRNPKRRKARRIVIRRARRNPVRKRKVAKRRRNPVKGKAMRPRIYKRRSGYYRGPKSSLPKKMTLRNPRRRRKARKTYRRRTRRNPQRFSIRRTFRTAFSQQRLIKLASITGGIAGGFLLKPVLVNTINKIPGGNAEWVGRFGIGALHILLGSVMASMVRNKDLKTAGIALASTGIYDIIAENFEQLGLPKIPQNNILTDQFLGASYEFGAKSTLGASYGTGNRPVSPVAGGSGLGCYGATVPAYMGASYEDPSMQTAGLVGDDPYAGISWG